MLKKIMMFTLGVGLLPGHAASSDQCKDVLIPAQYSGDFSTTRELAIMQTIRSEKDFQKGRGASVSRTKKEPGFLEAWSGSYNKFETKRNSLFSQYSYKNDFHSSSTIASSALSEAAIAAWRRCMGVAKPIEFILEDPDSKSASLVIKWKKPTNVTMPSGGGFFNITGNDPEQPDPALHLKKLVPNGWGEETSRTIIIERAKKSPLRITMNLGNYSTSIYVPYIEQIKTCKDNAGSQVIQLDYVHVDTQHKKICGHWRNVNWTEKRNYVTGCITNFKDAGTIIEDYDCGGTPGRTAATNMSHEEGGVVKQVKILSKCSNLRNLTGRTDLQCN